jgi:hypothetical protein
MASKQESVSDWMALAKAYDKAEREQEVTPYVVVSLRNRRTNEELYRYDLPREMFWRWHWVIDWRAARLLCQNPKDGINHVLSFYDRKTGLEYGFGSLISGLTSAKANVTIVTNKLQEYIQRQAGNMFFDEASDEIVQKFKAKISAYRAKAAGIEEQIKAKVQQLKKQLYE